MGMNNNNHPPSCRTYQIELPLTTLHIMEAGSGPPLIVVPATISELENWVDLVQFMAQWFRVYFFELPGHGRSTPFQQKFSTHLVAQTVRDMVDSIGAARFSLMGFSFGGILAMRSFSLLHRRVDRLILNAPCVTKQALLLSRAQKFTMRRVNAILRKRLVQIHIQRAFHHPRKRELLMRFFRAAGKMEITDQLRRKLAKIEISTIEVLTEEISEILEFEFPSPAAKYATPCYFTMSVHDPLLDYQVTLNELQHHFSTVHVTKLYFPFHQPPKPFTFDELNRDYGESAAKFMNN